MEQIYIADKEKNFDGITEIKFTLERRSAQKYSHRMDEKTEIVIGFIGFNELGFGVLSSMIALLRVNKGERIDGEIAKIIKDFHSINNLDGILIGRDEAINKVLNRHYAKMIKKMNNEK
mgnify:CR=1 FL=1